VPTTMAALRIRNDSLKTYGWRRSSLIVAA
jgi:hypothetical protein